MSAKTNQPPTKKKSWILRTIITVVILIVVTIAAVVGFIAYKWNDLENDFDGSEQVIDKEFTTLALPLGEPISRTYRHGVCLDNCPKTIYKYTLSSPQNKASLSESLKQTLTNHGYKMHDGFNGSKSNNGEYTISIFPGSPSNNNELVDSLDVNLQYVPQ